MKTRTLFLFVALLLSVSGSKVYANKFIEFYKDGIYYYISGKDKKEKVAVVYHRPNNLSTLYSGMVVIPEKVKYKGKTYPVTMIGSSAFKDCVKLKEVVIPNSVTVIDSYAFSGCTGLKNIKIPNSVTSIGWRVFSGCI